jgi:hypothetical protein
MERLQHGPGSTARGTLKKLPNEANSAPNKGRRSATGDFL